MTQKLPHKLALTIFQSPGFWRLKKRFNSISLQVTLYSFLGTFVVLLLTWIVLYGLLTKTLGAQDRGLMEEHVVSIASMLQSNGSNPEILKARVEKEWARRKYDRFFVRILRQDGSMVTETPLSADGEQNRVLGVIETDDARAFKQARRFKTLTSALTTDDHLNVRLDEPFEKSFGDSYFRITTAVVTVKALKQFEEYRIEIAMDRSSEETLLAAYRATLFFVIIIGFLVSSLIAWLMLRSAVDPIAAITKTADEVNSEMLGRRLDLDPLPNEFHHLANTFNAMLDRLEGSFERLARFSADMAHELRTPVGNILGAFEVGVSRPRSSEEYEKLLLLGIEESSRLRRIIESLLFIARASAPIESARLQLLRLDLELQEIISFYEPLAQESGMTIQLQIEPEAADAICAPVERTLLQRAVGNLISNSIRYSGGSNSNSDSIIVRLSRVEERNIHAKFPQADFNEINANSKWAIIQVIDRGEGMNERDLLRVGERFFRTDRSRSKSSGGTGLGLSIVRGIMTAHRGHFLVESAVNRGTQVSLLFSQAFPD